MDKYMKRSFTKLRTALAILIACCLTTDMYAQTAVATDSVATDTVAQLVSGVNTVWMLLAAMLVFFMQPGFALVEAGFTRTKNTANILMKNFVDFMFGSLLYWLVGFGIMFGLGDFFGTPYLMSLLFDSNGLPTPLHCLPKVSSYSKPYSAPLPPQLFRELWQSVQSFPCIWFTQSSSAY